MAGVGSGCGHLRRNLKSCLTEGRIDVLKGRSKGRGCSYMKGVTSGVLCCKKPKKKAKYWDNCEYIVKLFVPLVSLHETVTLFFLLLYLLHYFLGTFMLFEG